MKTNRIGIRALTAAALVGAASGLAYAQPEYDFILIDSLNRNPLAGEAFMWDINDLGMACGVATIDNEIGYPGIVWDEDGGRVRVSVASPQSLNNLGLVVGIGDILDLGTGQVYVMPNLPGTYFAPQFGGVNDAGVAVGSISTCTCSDSGGVLRIPYVWDAVNGATTVSVPNAKGLSRVNNSGLAIGWQNGWIFNEGFIVNLTTGEYTLMNDVFPSNVGTGPTRVFDISNTGKVVGTRQGTGSVARYGYVYSADAGVQLLPFPGTGYMQAVRPFGINSDGTIVGEINTVQASSRAFVYTPGTGTRDLNDSAIVTGVPLGYTMRTAQKINEEGWIVGNGQTAGGKNTGYVLRPRGTPCAADFNQDGTPNSQDYFDFLSAFFAGTAGADFNRDGSVNSQDYFDFVSALFAGC